MCVGWLAGSVVCVWSVGRLVVPNRKKPRQNFGDKITNRDNAGLTEKTKTTTKGAEKYLENMGVPHFGDKITNGDNAGLTEKTKTTTKSAEKYLENMWGADEQRAAQMTHSGIRN